MALGGQWLKIGRHRHAELPELFGFPAGIGWLADAIFEGLPVSEAPAWTLAWPSAIAVGADLSGVLPRIRRAILTGYAEASTTERGEHESRGVLRHTTPGSTQRAAVVHVVSLIDRQIAGWAVTREEWSAARDQAWGAARYADAAAADARISFWRWLSQELLALLADAPVPT